MLLFIMMNSPRIANSITSIIRNGEVKNRPILTRLIAKRAWLEIEDILASGSIDSIEIDDAKIITESCVVHFALRHGAPLNIIQLLAVKYPRCLTTPDPTGKYACHVACKYGAVFPVVEFLVRMNKYLAGIPDPSGKAPIHYVGEFYAAFNESSTGMEMNEHMLRVVYILREAAPQSFILEDMNGCNAIEYAIGSDADIKIIKTMQRTARDDWRAMKASGCGKRHDELAKDVERSASGALMHLDQCYNLCSIFNQSHVGGLPRRTIISKHSSSAA
ncbi:hypothetical protein ACHAXH_000887 [Discostella pseudostelligera]|jgi:hypothetical protein